MNAPGVANRESVSCFKFESLPQRKLTPPYIEPDFFLPFSTRMYDLRVNGNNFCEWSEEFVINEFASTIF